MSDNKWTPEPWYKAHTSFLGTEVFKKPYGIQRIGHFHKGEDAERAVECVNALAGVDKPKEYIETILNQREELAEQVDLLQKGMESCMKQRDELAVEVERLKNTLDEAITLIQKHTND